MVRTTHTPVSHVSIPTVNNNNNDKNKGTDKKLRSGCAATSQEGCVE